MSYSSFASVYDRLMQDASYSERADYIISLFARYGKMPSLLLDAACGTGSISVLMAKKGIETIGVDLSPEMLSVAGEKAAAAEADVLFLCQNLKDLDLFGTVDGCICTLDSINHITDIPTLRSVFKKIALFSEPGSLFIFDVNTPYKHRHVLGNNTFVIEEDDLYCVWSNCFSPKEMVTDIFLDFFVCEGDVYKRTSEEFRERAYTPSQLRGLLSEAGFEVLDILDDMSYNSPSSKSQRNVYVCRRMEW